MGRVELNPLNALFVELLQTEQTQGFFDAHVVPGRLLRLYVLLEDILICLSSG